MSDGHEASRRERRWPAWLVELSHRDAIVRAYLFSAEITGRSYEQTLEDLVRRLSEANAETMRAFADYMTKGPAPMVIVKEPIE